MSYHSLNTVPIIKMWADMQKVMEKVARTSGLPRGPVRAKVVDVEDPQERGRVRVLFDSVNYKEIAQVTGAGEYSKSRDGKAEYLSHWIDTSPAFKGRQPEGLIGKRVNIILSNAQYPYAILQDVLHDKELLTDEAANKLEIPNNSPMSRLPVYSSGKLPPATKENVGCIIVETGGPQGDDWLMVCLKRGGKYMWVRHIDRLHYHTGQLPDSRGDREKRTYDSTVETTGSPKEGSN